LKGLVYYKDPTGERPYASDTLLITVAYAIPDSQRNDEYEKAVPHVLAGAKLPLNRVRLPLRFRLTRENLLLDEKQLQGSPTVEKVLAEQDLIVQAFLCSDETVRRHPKGRDLVDACRHREQQRNIAGRTLEATAVAKLLRLPQLNEPIRAPVSLPLEWQ
jgi:hypothetical protein